MKKLNFKFLNISLWVSLLTAFFIPGKLILTTMPNKIEYGFPIKYLTEYNINYADSTWFFSGKSFLIGNFVLNVIIIYAMILLFNKLYLLFSGKKE